jgi:His-Xaa-Ser system protein HxsD
MAENKPNFVLDLKIYPLEAVYGASYVFIDRAYVFLEDAGKEKVKVSFKGKKNPPAGGDKKALEVLQGEFLNELLNYTLRVSLENNNKKIRQQIVERALYSSIGTEDDIWE